MLYITTRNHFDISTSYKPLISDCGADGGRYVPFRLPEFSQEELISLNEKSFNQIIAEILNVFFSCRLDSLDLDFEIGRNPMRLVTMNHRIVIAELWHNPKAAFSYVTERIYSKIIQTEEAKKTPTDWVQIAVRIAVIFGIYSQILRNDIIKFGQCVDFSVYNDDFATPMAVWYSMKMGLPVNMIICTSEDDNNIWDFIHRGVFASAAANEGLLLGLERLVHGTLGEQEVASFIAAYQKGKVYSVDEELLPVFNEGLFCAVAGKNRAESTINSLYRTNSYIIDPCAALCYGGLQDYRARTGGSSLTVLLAERTPLDFKAEISAATGIGADKLIDYVKLN